MNSPLPTVRRFLYDVTYRQLSKDELWSRYRDDGDNYALSLFREGIVFRMLARCRAIIGDDDLAEDAVQVAFMLLDRQRRRIGRYGQAVAWLYKATDSQSRMMVRSRRRARVRDVRAARPEAVSDYLPSVFEVATLAVIGLPITQRPVVELVYCEGMTYQEAADALGLSRHAVESRVRRGLDTLREKLGPVDLRVVLAAGFGATAVPASVADEVFTAGTATWLTAKKLLVGVAGGLLIAGGVSVVATTAAKTQAVVSAPPAFVPERVSDRSLRMFHADILPQQTAALRGLLLGDGEVRLTTAVAFDSRLEVAYELAHRRPDGQPWFVTRVWMRHQTWTGETHTEIDRFGTGERVATHPDRFLILGLAHTNPLGKELVVPSGPLRATVGAFGLLPRDGATEDAASESDDRVRAYLPRLYGQWRDESGATLTIRPCLNGGIETPLVSDGNGWQFHADWGALRVDDAGRLWGVKLSEGGPATVTADGRRLKDIGTSRLWVRLASN